MNQEILTLDGQEAQNESQSQAEMIKAAQVSPEIVVDEIEDLADPKLRQVAMRVVNTFKIAADKAIAHLAEPANYQLPADAQSAEHFFVSYFNKLRPVQRGFVKAKVMPRVKAPEIERARLFGDLAKVNLRLTKPVMMQVKSLPFPAALRFSKDEMDSLLNRLAGPVHRPLFAATPAAAAGAPELDKLELLIHRVRCVGETGTWFEEVFGGADEIDLGGVTVDETGDSKKIRQFRVGEFEERDVVRYNPPRRFTMFNLREGGNNWPKHYYVTLVLSEIDFGGAGDFISNLYDKVKSEVQSALNAAGIAVGELIGTAIGGAVGIIGAAVGFVLGKIIDWIIGALGDEVFPPKTVHTRIHGLTNLFRGDSAESQPRVLKFIGHDGEYHLVYSWRKFS
jgi:hypothetical protein